MVTLETTDCPLCGSPDKELAEVLEWKGGELVYAVCTQCGLKYMTQRPTREWYAEFYRNEFWQQSRLLKRSLEKTGHDGHFVWHEVDAGAEELEKKDLEKNRRKQTRRAERIWQICEPFVQLDAGSTVLEIGAGWGAFLGLVGHKYGCRTAAVEPSEMARQHMAQQLGIQLAGRVLEEIDRMDGFKGKTDLVVCSHVLENTIDPIENLKKIRSLLSPEGVLYVDTPNLYYKNAINPYHPYIFSPETIKAFLFASGLEPIHAVHEAHPAQVNSISDATRAKYISVIARPGEVEEKVFPPATNVREAQKKGERLMSARSGTSPLKARLRALASLLQARS